MNAHLTNNCNNAWINVNLFTGNYVLATLIEYLCQQSQFFLNNGIFEMDDTENWREFEKIQLWRVYGFVYKSV